MSGVPKRSGRGRGRGGARRSKRVASGSGGEARRSDLANQTIQHGNPMNVEASKQALIFGPDSDAGKLLKQMVNDDPYSVKALTLYKENQDEPFTKQSPEYVRAAAMFGAGPNGAFKYADHIRQYAQTQKYKDMMDSISSLVADKKVTETGKARL